MEERKGCRGQTPTLDTTEEEKEEEEAEEEEEEEEETLFLVKAFSHRPSKRYQ